MDHSNKRQHVQQQNRGRVSRKSTRLIKPGQAKIHDLEKEEKSKIGNLIKKVIALDNEVKTKERKSETEKETLSQKVTVLKQQNKDIIKQHVTLRSKFQQSLQLLQNYQLKLNLLHRNKIENEKKSHAMSELQKEIDMLKSQLLEMHKKQNEFRLKNMINNNNNNNNNNSDNDSNDNPKKNNFSGMTETIDPNNENEENNNCLNDNKSSTCCCRNSCNNVNNMNNTKFNNSVKNVTNGCSHMHNVDSNTYCNHHNHHNHHNHYNETNNYGQRLNPHWNHQMGSIISEPIYQAIPPKPQPYPNDFIYSFPSYNNNDNNYLLNPQSTKQRQREERLESWEYENNDNIPSFQKFIETRDATLTQSPSMPSMIIGQCSVCNTQTVASPSNVATKGSSTSNERNVHISPQWSSSPIMVANPQQTESYFIKNVNNAKYQHLMKMNRNDCKQQIEKLSKIENDKATKYSKNGNSRSCISFVNQSNNRSVTRSQSDSNMIQLNNEMNDYNGDTISQCSDRLSNYDNLDLRNLEVRNEKSNHNKNRNKNQNQNKNKNKCNDDEYDDDDDDNDSDKQEDIHIIQQLNNNGFQNKQYIFNSPTLP